ncbi:MAG: diacylglycerol/lipid kinase family protein [Deltaproteobacteria bacterium]
MIVAIVNPRSANGSTARLWPELAGRLARSVGEVSARFTTGPGQATDLTREALRAGASLVLSVGGDGTHNEVANGFFEGGQPVRPEAAMGIIPAGTGGDFRRAFGWSADPREAIGRLATGARRKIDVGRLTFSTDRGEAVRHFVNVASFGIGGLVDDRVNHTTKILGGKASFALASLRALVAYRDQQIRLSLDDEPARELLVTSIAVANGQYFGGGMWVAPEARPDDGLFDITIWQGFGLADFVLRAGRLYDGSHRKLPGTTMARARRVRAESDEIVLLDVDGEQPGRLPATFELLPGALSLAG